MNPIDLIVTVCAVLSPATCEEQHLVFSYAGSPAQCSMAAPPYIAQWIGEHPKWQAVRWRCEYPHMHDRADARGQAQHLRLALLDPHGEERQARPEP